jgi:hypothetical protein
MPAADILPAATSVKVLRVWQQQSLVAGDAQGRRAPGARKAANIVKARAGVGFVRDAAVLQEISPPFRVWEDVNQGVARRRLSVCVAGAGVNQRQI